MSDERHFLTSYYLHFYPFFESITFLKATGVMLRRLRDEEECCSLHHWWCFQHSRAHTHAWGDVISCNSQIMKLTLDASELRIALHVFHSSVPHARYIRVLCKCVVHIQYSSSILLIVSDCDLSDDMKSCWCDWPTILPATSSEISQKATCRFVVVSKW